MKYWAGIDPGKTGAIALVNSENVVCGCNDFPTDEVSLNLLLTGWEKLGTFPELVFLEKQQSFGIEGRKSLASLMENYGIWKGMLSAHGWPFQTVAPNVWKSGLGYPKDKKQSKSYSLSLARRLYPGFAETWLSRAKDHNRAEALILAYLAKNGLQTSVK